MTPVIWLVVWNVAATSAAIVGWSLLLMERSLFRTHIADAREVNRYTLGAVTSAMAYGTPDKPEAVVEEREPDAEDRVSQRIREDTIAAGAARLIAEHANAGITLSEEEARLQATSMLLGNIPVVQGLGTARFRD